MRTESSTPPQCMAVSRRGFTLVEMTVSLAILALLAAFGTAIFQRVQVNSKDNAQITTVSSLVREAQAQYPFSAGVDRWTASLATASSDVLFAGDSGPAVVATLQRVDPVIPGAAYAASTTDVSYSTRVDDSGVATLGVASVSSSGNCVALLALPNDIVESWSWGRPLAASCTGASALLGPDAVIP